MRGRLNALTSTIEMDKVKRVWHCDIKWSLEDAQSHNEMFGCSASIRFVAAVISHKTASLQNGPFWNCVHKTETKSAIDDCLHTQRALLSTVIMTSQVLRRVSTSEIHLHNLLTFRNYIIPFITIKSIVLEHKTSCRENGSTAFVIYSCNIKIKLLTKCKEMFLL